VGEPIVAKVLTVNAGDKKRIDLTLDPSKVHSHLESTSVVQGLTMNAVVISKEDHGFVVDLGIKGTKAFMSSKEANKSDYIVGQLLRVVVLKIASRKIVHVSSLEDKISAAAIPSSSVIGLDQLTCGALVHSKVSNVLDSGLKVLMMGAFDATIESSHCGSVDLEESFRDGEKIKSRIVWIDYISKTIGLSLLDHFITWKHVTFTFSVGDIKENVQVVRVDDRIGVLMKWDQSHFAYAHISKLRDDRILKIDDTFGPGTEHKARITGLDYCTNLLLVSLQPKVLDQAFVRLEDIKIASDVKGVVEKIESFGLIVAVTDTIKGLCPTAHLSDAKISHPEKLFKLGSSLTFRVLTVDPEKNRLILTHKKSLMGPKSGLVMSYDQVSPGDVVTGVITSVQDYGCIVSFFNDVRALAPIAELAHEKITHPSTLFKIGQSVKCRVLTVDAVEAKMRVTLKVSQIASGAEAKVGHISQATFISANIQGIIVQLEESRHNATVPWTHLHDHYQTSEKLFKAFSSGSSKKNIDLGEVLIMAVDPAKGVIHATMKQLLIQYAKEKGSLPASADDLRQGFLVPGVVKNITEKLCFVQLGNTVAVANIHVRYTNNNCRILPIFFLAV
jgi:rRNA biogenesis protein RRP5